jgi:benzoyl-CoA reductase/2-hydroxyglutaryl-CoA dehydratase subunit BcrC/BadD/HgdB
LKNGVYKDLIGYACSYIPVELLSATGLRPYRLLHGDINLSKAGEKVARVDACPLVKSNLARVLANKDRFAALVGSTGCDMSRRMFDIIAELTDIPVYVLHNPRTESSIMYNDEIDWLANQLENLSKTSFSDTLITGEIHKWESMREELRAVDRKRSANPSLVSTTDFHKATINYYKGTLEGPTSFRGDPSDKPRVYLLGSAIAYEANQILQLLEKQLRIVGDFNCGLSRVLNISIKDKNVEGIKRAYYDQPPCAFKRPHRKFYDHIERRVNELNCIGIVAWTLDYCDVYEFEIQRIEKQFDRPVLRIRSDFSFQNTNQLRTRVNAFTEMLCSKI